MRELLWISSAKKDLKAMPDEVQHTFGYALHLAQAGKKHRQAKSMQGFGSAGVLEIVEDAQGGTYRAIYALKIGDAIYVLHCFQKKSTHGISTPKPDMDLIRDRMKAAQEHAQSHGAKK